MNIEIILYSVLIGSGCALFYSIIRTIWIIRQPVQNKLLKTISGYVADGAMAFIKREYSILLIFAVIVAALLAVFNKGAIKFQAIAFLLGSGASALSGFIGLKVATASNSRTTQAAQKGLNPALKIAFAGGSVMGMCVVGLSLLGIFVVMFLGILIFGKDVPTLATKIFQILPGFSLGASSIALFARVGGGIFTKAADVGADLVGKVEKGIPEDDPRNPAVIADNVGDNVGDVAGMGADLFESYVGSIVGSLILAISIHAPDVIKLKLLGLPLLLPVVGVICSIIGIYFVKTKEGKSPQNALNQGTIIASILTAILSYFVIMFIMQGSTYNIGTADKPNLVGHNRLFFASMLGLVVGVIIGFITQYFTSTGTKAVKSIVKATETGTATTIITGLEIGMISSFPEILVICAGLIGSFVFAGLFGVSLAGLGMLVTLGIQLAVDAYGPIADNAGGLAVMSKLSPKVREITDQLDAVGNTTAAIGKGFAIGSAALTAIILFASFKELSGLTKAIDISHVPVLAGILLGAAIPFLFSAMAMGAVGRAAMKMIEEVRRQFKEKPGILKNKETPDYKKCVDISTKAAIKEMVLPGVITIITPILVGFLGGVEMLTGLLTGVTASGVILAIFLANSGGAWDNAKKMIEGGIGGGKGSERHKSAVVGDTIGDPFKDTAGPSLNILIKLMAIISLVIAPMLKIFWKL